MTFLDELADELVVLFAADAIIYAEYLESIAVMDAEVIKTVVRISVTTWEFRRRLRRIEAEQKARHEGEPLRDRR